MFSNLIHFVTYTTQDTWTLLVTHPVVTIPGLGVLTGAMLVLNRRTRTHD